MDIVAPVLETNGLTAGYGRASGDVVLFERLDLKLFPSQLVCFMGPNGVGKSTLLRTMAGLQAPLSGTTPLRNEKNIAVVLTDKINTPQMTVEELITFGRYPHMTWSITPGAKDLKAINAAIDQLKVRHLCDMRIDQLSDGQLQMAMIARALAQDTPVMLLDEPTAHLDLNNRLEIITLLRRLAHDHDKAILVSTHELDLALQAADLIWLGTFDKTIISGIPEDLVLNGSFDQVFQFKGFDLKSGKVKHLPYRQKKVNLTGTGPEYLWTKNALDRNGYEVSELGQAVSVNGRSWTSNGQTFSTVADLLNYLTS